MANHSFGPQELAGRDMPFLVGGTVKESETPLKVHAQDFQALSGEFFFVFLWS